MPAPNIGLSSKKDERISFVQGILRHGNLCQGTLLFLALDAKQNRMFHIGLDVIKSRFNASIQILQTIKIVQKIVRFVTLHLSVLHGNTTQIVIRLDHLVGSRSVFILGRFTSNPHVNVVVQSIRIAFFVGIQNQIRVALVKFSVTLFGPGFDVELFNPPDPGFRALAHAVPGGFEFGSGRLDLVVQVGTD